jgi:hypothetical protein
MGDIEEYAYEEIIFKVEKHSNVQKSVSKSDKLISVL